ncbi:MAG: VWA domain-containing protein [Campylobacterota bacterium]|nr:VWA domain-containing protein [Campylobacterota bacterium]
MSTFHFLRPEYLLLLIPAWALVVWLLRQQSDEKRWQKVIDPALLKHLLVRNERNHSRLAAPWHLAIVLTLLVAAVSGPSWKLKPSPFVQDDTKIAFLISVKKSMLTTDISPNRLQRAAIKLTDLLQKRADTESALIAYSGTAHLVLPLTRDHSIIQTFAQALDPAIMPLEGDNIEDALLLAKKELNTKGATIIVLTDSVSPSSVKLAIKNGLDEVPSVIFWQIASNELSNVNDFKSASSLLNGYDVPYARDESDVAMVSSLIDKNFKSAAQGDKSKYEDGGYLLVPFIFLLVLLWSRQGFFVELWRRS